MTDRNNYRLINLTGRALSFTTHAVDGSYTIPPARKHALPHAFWSMRWEEPWGAAGSSLWGRSPAPM